MAKLGFRVVNLRMSRCVVRGRGGIAHIPVLLSLLAASLAAADRPPNFVVIFVDDLGYGDIGPFGSTVNRTPELDRMAAEGLKLTSFYAAPVCTPSRAALLTGGYPIRTGLQTGSWHAVLMPGDRHGLHSDEVTIAEVLKTKGYATGIVGKWHLGDQPEFLPTRHGFDEYYGLPYSNDMYPERRGGDRDFPPLPLLRGEKVVRAVNDQSVLTADYTREALDFIDRHRDEPFFLYLPHTMVHNPLHAGRRFAGKSANGVLGDCIEEIDWSTGAILDKLRELKLEKDTLVLFTSDNGPANGVSGPLRGKKGSTYEGGMRVPTLVWRPGTVPAGASYGGVTSTMDLLPTFTALAGASRSKNKIDGHDLSAILAGDLERPSPYRFFYYYRGFALRAVRSGDWKLHASGELYDLARDIGESEDVAAANPKTVARLTAALAEARRELGDGPPIPFAGRPQRGSGVRRVGRMENPRFLIPRPGADGRAAHAPVLRLPRELPTAVGPQRGALVIAGGGVRSPKIWRRFIDLAGGPDEPIVVIPTAGGEPRYSSTWEGLSALRTAGLKNVTLLHTYDRAEADSAAFAEPIDQARGVWFTGGRQWRLADSYLDTETHRALERLLARGGVIGGSSAGATIQGSYLARGDSRGNTVMMGDHEQGLGFLSNVAIDQHLLRRNRQFDLLEIIRARPGLLGIGIDEDTAIVVHGDRMEVVGESFVAIYDPERRFAPKGPFYLVAPGWFVNLESRTPYRP